MKKEYVVNVYGDYHSTFVAQYSDEEIETIKKFLKDMNDHHVMVCDIPSINFEAHENYIEYLSNDGEKIKDIDSVHPTIDKYGWCVYVGKDIYGKHNIAITYDSPHEGGYVVSYCNEGFANIDYLEKCRKALITAIVDEGAFFEEALRRMFIKYNIGFLLDNLQ